MGLFGNKKAADDGQLFELLQQSQLPWASVQAVLPKRAAAKETLLFQQYPNHNPRKETPLHTALRSRQSVAVMEELLALEQEVRQESAKKNKKNQNKTMDGWLETPDAHGNLPLHVASQYLATAVDGDSDDADDELHHHRNITILQRLKQGNARAATKLNAKQQLPLQVTLTVLSQKLLTMSSSTQQAANPNVAVYYLRVIQWYCCDAFSDTLIQRQDHNGQTLWHHMARIAARVPPGSSWRGVVDLMKQLAQPLVSKASSQSSQFPWCEPDGHEQTPFRVFQTEALEQRMEGGEFKHRRQVLASILLQWEVDPKSDGSVKSSPSKIVSGVSSNTMVSSSSRKSGTLHNSNNNNSTAAVVHSSTKITSGRHFSLLSSDPQNPNSSQDALLESDSASSPPPRTIDAYEQTSSSLNSTLSSITAVTSRGVDQSLSMRLDDRIVQSLFTTNRGRPFDVFLVHTGNEKYETASNLKAYLEISGFRCFLDERMENSHGPPVAQMRWGLETCRYAICLISEHFLQKKHPCAELEYCYQREQWLHDRYHWRSMHVILYNVTVEDYSKARTDPDRPASLAPLPQLEKSHVLKEYGNNQKKSFYDFTVALAEEMTRHDAESAGSDWVSFLQTFSSSCEAGFPRAHQLYQSSKDSA